MDYGVYSPRIGVITMDSTGYTIQFEQDPWGCLISRAGEIIFHVSADENTREVISEDNSHLFRFSTKSLSIQIHPDRISFEWIGQEIHNRIRISGHWYGGGNLINQYLRWNQIMLPLAEFATNDNGPTGLTTMLSPIWLNSQGVALSVLSPFQLGFNQPPSSYLERQKGISQDLIPFKQRPFLDLKREGDGWITLVGDDLSFEVFLQDNILESYRALRQTYATSDQTPPLELMEAPIWTTWARYKDQIDQETVLRFGREIRDHDFPYHVMEIDDRWQSAYGDLEFDPERFPDPKSMISRLKEMGFKVTLWVMPFFHPHSRSGQEAARLGYVVQTAAGEPYRIQWWQGGGYLLDVTHPQALEWMNDRLAQFKEDYDLDGYKFDAGEAKFVPSDGIFHEPLASSNEYTHRYINWIAANHRFCEVRSGWKNQSCPVFFRLWDIWSTWGHDNGLRSIIPSTLSLSLSGYPFVFPDMIGGNAYFRFPTNRILIWFIQKILIPILERRLKQDSSHPEEETLGLSDVPSFLEKSVYFGYPTPELIIRWAQANTFLQVMQFSLAPWDFGEEATRICRQYAELHLEFAPLLQKFARQAAATGEPIIRPVFWLAPEDQRALVCEDQFLVGDEILVAPALYPQQRAREIYFPPGTWKDYWSERTYHGPTVIKNHPAPLDRLPFFIRITD